MLDDASQELLQSILDVEFLMGDEPSKLLRFFTAHDFRKHYSHAPAGAAFADAIEAAGLVTAGELVAWQRAALSHSNAAAAANDSDGQEPFCVRCGFEFAVQDVVEFGVAIETSDSPPLTEEEAQILKVCQEWAVSDAIERCRE